MEWTLLGQQIINGITTGVAYVIFALGLTLIYGVLKVTNIAHGEYFMLGAMLLATVIELTKINYFIALIPVVIVIALLGFLTNRSAVRPLLKASPLSTLLSTLAISVILYNTAMAFWPSPKNVMSPINGVLVAGGIRITYSSLLCFGLGVVVIVVLYFFIYKIRLGKEIDATAQNITGASLTGINVPRVYDTTFVIAAVLAAVGGMLVAPLWQVSSGMGQALLLKGFAVVIVGGMGNILGAVWVGILAGVGESLFAQYVSAYYKEGFLFGVMIISLLIKPKGLFTRK
jgi:branched-chain amino acid transport system permease protein